jgi:hypothetical protein
MFKKGRTEVIRSCSNESVHFAKTMLNAGAAKEAKFRAMADAIRGNPRRNIEELFYNAHNFSYH